MVYLLDPTSGTAMSQDHQFLAQSIAERYPDVRLAQIPMSDRSVREEFPFALTHAITGETLKPLRESECTISYVYQWLYEHDTQSRGVKEVYEKFLADKARAKKVKEDAVKEKRHEDLEVVHFMATTNLHSVKHGNRRIG